MWCGPTHALDSSRFEHCSNHSRNFFCKFFLKNGRRQPFWMYEIHFRSHFLPFQIYAELLFFIYFLTKWPSAAILDGTTMSIIELVRDIWINNACVKFEERSLYPSKVIALTTTLWRGRGGGRKCVSREYNYIFLISPYSGRNISNWYVFIKNCDYTDESHAWMGNISLIKCIVTQIQYLTYFLNKYIDQYKC